MAKGLGFRGLFLRVSCLGVCNIRSYAEAFVVTEQPLKSFQTSVDARINPPRPNASHCLRSKSNMELPKP